MPPSSSTPNWSTPSVGSERHHSHPSNFTSQKTGSHSLTALLLPVTSVQEPGHQLGSPPDRTHISLYLSPAPRAFHQLSCNRSDDILTALTPDPTWPFPVITPPHPDPPKMLQCLRSQKKRPKCSLWLIGPFVTSLSGTPHRPPSPRLALCTPDTREWFIS